MKRAQGNRYCRIGGHLLNSVTGEDISLGYWRKKQDEVDFVLYNDSATVAFEEKSGGRTHGRGMDAFLNRYPDGKVYSVSSRAGTDSMTIPLEEFLLEDPLSYLA